MLPSLPFQKTARLKIHPQTRLIILALTVGLLSGGVNVLFRLVVQMIAGATHRLWGTIIGIPTEAFSQVMSSADSFIFLANWRWLFLPLLPLTGAGAIWLLSRFTKHFQGGYGFARFLVAVNVEGAILSLRKGLLSGLAAAVTIGTGFSAGLEGPVAQLGGTVGSSFGRILGSSGRRQRLLVACGTAAAIASNFNAPIAGVLFAFEIVLLGNYEIASFGAIIISAGISTLISRWAFGDAPAFHPPNFKFLHAWELLVFTLLGVGSGYFGAHFGHLYFRFQDWIEKRIPQVSNRFFAGALLVGVIAIAFPQVMGSGYEPVQAILNSNFPPLFLFGSFMAKAVATIVTLSCGMVGGLFGPALLMGTMFGAGIGSALSQWLPLSSQASSYAMLGMAGFLAAIAHAPLTSIFLLFEMTGNYQVVIPAMFTTILAVTVSRRIRGRTIDHEELHRLGVELEEGRDLNVLSSLRVIDVMLTQFVTIPAGAPLRKVMEIMATSNQTYFPVIDAESTLLGMLSFQDIRSVILEHSLADVVVAAELASRDTVTVRTSEPLTSALDKFETWDLSALPVVDGAAGPHVVGLLTRKDVVDAYNREVLLREYREK